MKKVLADFADDADFSGRNILKLFSRKVAKCFAKYAKIFKVFLSFRRNLNSKFSVIICRDSCGMTKWMLIFNADFSVNEKLKGVYSPDCSGNPAVSIGLSNGTRNCNEKQD